MFCWPDAPIHLDAFREPLQPPSLAISLPGSACRVPSTLSLAFEASTACPSLLARPQLTRLPPLSSLLSL